MARNNTPYSYTPKGHLYLLNLHTGFRIDELLSLEWSQVNLFNKTILIQKSKNGKPKTLPLNQIVIDILVEKSKVRNIRNDLVFTGSAGTKIDSDNLRYLLVLKFHATFLQAGLFCEMGQ